MPGVISVIDLTITFLKHVQYGGITMWFVVQTTMWFFAAWWVISFFLNRLSAGE